MSQSEPEPQWIVPSQRKHLRLPDYDYATPGIYFVTVSTHRRACLFGSVVHGGVLLNDAGHTVESCWLEIPRHFDGIDLDKYVVMPNHVHGLLVLRHGGVNFGAVVAGFKSAATRRIREAIDMSGPPVWQRGYHEHVVRSQKALARIRQYVVNNPIKWDLDDENPERTRRQVPR